MSIGLSRRSIGPAIAIAVFCVLIIGGIAALTVERIGYERGEAVNEVKRENARLALGFEQYAVRSLRAAEMALDVLVREHERGARTVSVPGFPELAVVDASGRVLLGTRPAGSAIVLSRAIVRPDGSPAGAALVAVPPETFSAFAPDAELLPLEGEGAVAAAARAVRDGSLVSVGPDGVARYISYRTLAHYPLVAAVASRVDETLAPFDSRSRAYVRNAWLATIAVVLLGAALITAWVSLGRSEQQFRQLAAHIPQAFWMTDLRSRRALYLSPAFRAISGLASRPAAQAWEGWKRLVHPEDRGAALEFYADTDALRGEIEHRIVRPDGSVRWVRARGFPVHEATGELYRIAGTIEDVTEARAAAEKLLHQAQYDTLTDLPNRLLCYDRLAQAIAQARRRHSMVAVLFVDLDRFKTVNDTLGHAVGDGLLREAARRLQRCVRAGDTVARVGGDEFAVVLSELGRPQDAGAVAQKMIDAMNPPMQLECHEVFTTVSVGIAAYPGDGADGDTLMRNADAAMFKAKQAGRSRFQYYTAAMNERAMEDLLIENDLRRALERDEFELYYQPKQHLASGRVSGLEALLRWRHPGRGLVGPATFVPLLEDSGMIVKVGDWVIRTACLQLRDWQKAGVPVAPVAVNLCAKQFLHHDLLQVLERALAESGVPGSLLQVEVTESDAMQRPEEVVGILTRLKALGVRVAIDDFGTGYSSLSYLKRLPIDTLKLDRSFVTGLPGDAEDVAITRAVVAMAHGLGLKVIAEGVEHEAQRAFLETLGCDELQGYLGSDPLPAHACARFLTERAKIAA